MRQKGFAGNEMKLDKKRETIQNNEGDEKNKKVLAGKRTKLAKKEKNKSDKKGLAGDGTKQDKNRESVQKMQTRLKNKTFFLAAERNRRETPLNAKKSNIKHQTSKLTDQKLRT